MKLVTLLIAVFASITLLAVEDWDVPQVEKENVSILMFDEEFVTQGQILYDNSCKSCHGTPTQKDFSLMLPSPGDVASIDFQKNTDGELFHKIKAGRGSMPKFEDAYEQDELWYLVAYIRSFNPNYEQPKPNLEGIVIPKITLDLSYDENVDKLVVKTLDENGKAMQDVSVKAFIKGTFGNFLLGKVECNELGIAYFNVDSKMPGDESGNLEVIVKASKGYGTAKVTKTMQMVEPVIHISAIEGRHLWSTSKKAPYWLKITFLITIISIWGAIFYILFGLGKLKKHS